jgi:hypothetical protein
VNADSDRRSAKRIPARVGVRVRSAGISREASAQTRDISRNGIFLYTDSPMAEGSELELVLILPAELTFGENCWVCCHAQVLRVEEEGGKQFGVAARIERMDILPEIPA